MYIYQIYIHIYFHIYILYIYIYANIYTYTYIHIYINGHTWSTTHRVLKSHSRKMSEIYMQSWKQCGLSVITKVTHHVPKCMSCHKVIVVITRRAHCFYDCIYIHINIYIYIHIYIYICVYISEIHACSFFRGIRRDRSISHS